MYSISQAVDAELKTKPYLYELIELNLVNITELARFLRADIEEICMKPVSVEALAMAIRRISRPRIESDLAKLFAKSPEIMVRLNLYEFTVRKRDTMQKVQTLMAGLSHSDAHFFTVTQGIYEDTVIMSRDYVDHARSLFEPHEILSELDGIGAVTVRLDPSNVHIPGVYYHILRGLFLEHINVVEIVSTHLECTLLVAESDAERTFKAVKQLFKSPSHPQ